jgi:triphosphatase
MEIEAKFTIRAALSPARIHSLDLHPYRLGVEQVEEHLDTLLDTADRRITGALCALRVRAAGETLTLTFKGPNQGKGGVHAREELEASLMPPLSLDPKTWPEPVGSRVRKLINDEKLTPLLRVAVERRTWSVQHGSRLIGELALDSGAILAAGRREPLHELELELKGAGARADLAALSAQLCEWLPIEPERRSKLARGLALLRHGQWTLDGYTPITALARHYLRQKTRALRRGAHHVLSDGDADAIHDMRVAIRRLRSALMNMEGMPVYKPRPLRKLRKGLGGVATSLGEIRDLDIALGLIAGLTPKHDDSGEPDPNTALARAIAQLKRRRDEAYEEVCRHMDRSKYERLLKALDRLTTPGEGERDGAPCMLTRDWAGGALFSRWEALAQHDDAFTEGDVAGMHEARIAAKRLRYTLEMLAPALGDAIKPVRAALQQFQERIGASLDIVNTRRAVSELDGLELDSSAIHDLIERLDEQRDQARTAARQAWGELVPDPHRRALARTAADLEPEGPARSISSASHPSSFRARYVPAPPRPVRVHARAMRPARSHTRAARRLAPSHSPTHRAPAHPIPRSPVGR